MNNIRYSNKTNLFAKLCETLRLCGEIEVFVFYTITIAPSGGRFTNAEYG